VERELDRDENAFTEGSHNESMESTESDKADHIKHEINVQDTEAKGPIYRYPSGVPGMSDCILGPHIPGSSKTASTTIVTPLIF
jgi:hypothetical protein